MALLNFIDTSADDEDTTPPPAAGGGPPGVSLLPPAAPSAGGGGDVASILVDYNDRFAGATPTRFRDELITQTLAALIGHAKPNVLLVGAAGVGKTRIVEDIARRIAQHDALIPDQLAGYTVYELPIWELVAGSGVVGALEEKVKGMIEFASDPANRAIVFLDEIHQLTGTGTGRDGTYAKIAQILKPALARGDLRVIGATTSGEARGMDADPAFARRFTRMVVDELTPDQTLEVLQTARAGLVAHYRGQIAVSDDVLEGVVRIADRYARAGQHRPDNALTLLDRAAGHRILQLRSRITQALAKGDTATAQTLRSTPFVPLELAHIEHAAQRLASGNATPRRFDADMLRRALTESLRGQEEVIEQLCDWLARQQLGLFDHTAPIAWLFAGASGVGKTEAAKIIAEQITGLAPVVLNMTEYDDASTIHRITGAPAGYIGYDSTAELVFDTLESNPYRVILLDEFEKADRQVQRLFLSALDEGTLRTNHGRHVDFSKAVIIATTNAARESLEGRQTGFTTGTTSLAPSSLTRELSRHFDAELLGRFSHVVAFAPVAADVYRDIISTQYASQRAQLVADKPSLDQDLPQQIPEVELAELAETTFDPALGGRPAVRAVRTWIEDRLLPAAPAPGTGQDRDEQEPSELDPTELDQTEDDDGGGGGSDVGHHGTDQEALQTAAVMPGADQWAPPSWAAHDQPEGW